MKFKSESDYRPMNKLCPDRRLTARTQSASSVLQGAETFCGIFVLYISSYVRMRSPGHVTSEATWGKEGSKN